GAELRLPAIPLVNPGWRLLSGLIAVLMALILYTLLNAPTFQVHQIEVTGLQRLTPADLQAVLAISGKPVVTIDPQAIKVQLESAFPELKDIRIRVILPARILITLTERQPVLAWQVGNDTYWIDPEGILIRPRGEVGDLPIVSANTLPPLSNVGPSKGKELAPSNPTEVWGQSTSTQLIQAILNLRQRLSPDIPLVYDSENGFGWQDPNGWQVLIGNSLHDFEAKMQLYQIILEQIQQRGLHPQVISLEHLQAPFYK
ncbi:MAG: cell division protein FtsQ/DivIB, partial [Thermanaerothrix sp.]|uniref:cell division protein FtsQ/DivIB n=1 Tax=Thermanaerothrix sp. TaxID=2972675 RepID=UPI003C7DC3A9